MMDGRIILGNAIINKKYLTQKELDNIQYYDVAFSFSDLGNRGNFYLMPLKRGLKIIQFVDGKRKRC